eukprot:3008347-Pyramimonas_sp.AAC.1
MAKEEVRGGGGIGLTILKLGPRSRQLGALVRNRSLLSVMQCIASSAPSSPNLNSLGIHRR